MVKLLMTPFGNGSFEEERSLITKATNKAADADKTDLVCWLATAGLPLVVVVSTTKSALRPEESRRLLLSICN